MGIGHINKVKVDLCSYPPYILLAPKKFGKTSFWSELVPAAWGDITKGLLISCGEEEGYHAIDQLQVEVAKTWRGELDEETGLRGFVEIVDDIVDNNAEYGLKGVCIDTLDTFIGIATQEVLRQHKKEKGTVVKTLNEAFSGYGRGKQRLFNICNEQIARLRSAGLAVFFLCHIKNKEKTDLRSGEKYEQITNNLTEDVFNNFGDAAQMVMVGTFDRVINNGRIESEERVVYLRGNSDIDAGSRFKYLPEKIHLDVHEFLDAFNEGVKGAMSKDKITEKDLKKLKESEDKDRETKAALFLKKDKAKRAIDEDLNEELKEFISTKYGELDTKQKKEFKTLMTEKGIKSFKDVSEIPTENLQALADFLDNL